MNRVFGILNRCTGNKEADTPAPGVCRKIYINIDTVYIENKSFLQYFFHIFAQVYIAVFVPLCLYLCCFSFLLQRRQRHAMLQDSFIELAQQTMVL